MERAEAREKARKVRFVILDIHGVLTDNTLYYTQEGLKSEAFSLHDRLGVKALTEAGIGIAFLTSKISRADEKNLRNPAGEALGLLREDREAR